MAPRNLRTIPKGLEGKGMEKGKTVRLAAVPAIKPLNYVLWDGTDPSDSQALGKGLSRLGWQNQVDATAQFATKAPNQPAVLQLAGADGFSTDDNLLFKGMFQVPQAVFGSALPGDSSGHSGCIVAVSGHGVPGFMFSESLLPIAMSRPIETTASDWRHSLGNWKYAPTPVWTDPKTKVVILSACRQLQGAPQQFFWARTMRGSDPLHVLLSYRETGPSAQASAAVNGRLLQHLKAGDPFVKAWKKAHSASSQSYRWAALCHDDAVDDTLADWMRLGHLPSRPDPKGTILYFDADTPNGRAVQEVRPDVDCWLTPRGDSARLPPWCLCANDVPVDLHVSLLAPGQRLQPEDRVFVVASQVRPDYFGPFSIQNLFTIEGQDALIQQGILKTARLIHEDAPDYGDDAYEITIRTTAGAPALAADGRSLTIPIKLGRAQNEHIPLFYFHVAIAGSGNRRFGVQSGRPIIDAFQFGMFRLPWRD